jgi:hypothetical protein
VAGAQTLAHPVSSAQSSEPATATNESWSVTPSVPALASSTFLAARAEELGLTQVSARPPLPGGSWSFNQCSVKVSPLCLLQLSR